MKVNKDAANAARRLFRLSTVDGKMDEEKLRKVIRTVAEKKPRNYRGILYTLKNLIRREIARKHVAVESAEMLDDANKARITEQMKKKFGNDLTFEYIINPALLGGIRVRKGDDVWDGSIKARLENLGNAF